jgi:hypothetical protein
MLLLCSLNTKSEQGQFRFKMAKFRELFSQYVIIDNIIQNQDNLAIIYSCSRGRVDQAKRIHLFYFSGDGERDMVRIVLIIVKHNN